MKTILAYTTIFFTISINTLVSGQSVKTLEFDSIAYSKDDAFFSYSVYDIFINPYGDVYMHELEDIANHYSNGRKTQLGRLVKVKLNHQDFDEIKNLISKINWANTKDSYRVSWSDKTTATLLLFNKGKMVKSVVDYGMVGTKSLIKLYTKLDGLSKTNSEETWNTEQLEIELFDETVIDSIEFIQHLKSEGSYYRNGVAKSRMLKGKELKEFISTSKKFCKENPYNNPKYEILTDKTDKYSLFIYFKNGEKEWVKYNGKRFMKKTYLDFTTRKNISKTLLK